MKALNPLLRACPATGCTKKIEPTQALCSEHWFKTPLGLRIAINQHWEKRDRKAWASTIKRAVQRLDGVAA